MSKKVWHCQKNRQIVQRNRENPEIYSLKHFQLIFEKNKDNTMERRKSLQQVVLRQLDIHKN